MKTWQSEIPFISDNPITEELFTESTIFFDIETTGFSPAHTHIYMIGCATRRGTITCITQFFAEGLQDEKPLLSAFFDLLSHYDTVITFNGLGFDVPYLKGRCSHHGLTQQLDSFHHLDLFKQISPFKNILKLPNVKQKSVEAFLGIGRDDMYSGGDLINVYMEYVKHPSEEGASLLKLHNYEDITGMVKLLLALSYQKLFNGCFNVISWETNAYEEYEGDSALELLLTLEPYYPLPKRFSFGYGSIYITGFQQRVKLKVKIYQGELKYFYPNYKDYYYLPAEDMAIHKSVAFYVDKDYRTRAKAATCYSKKTGCFLPQYQEIVTPYFKLEYHDKTTWFEMTDEFTNSPETQKAYALHLLGYLQNPKG